MSCPYELRDDVLPVLLLFCAASTGRFLSSCDVDSGALWSSDDDDDDDYDDDYDECEPDEGKGRPHVSCAVLDESVSRKPVLFVGVSCFSNRHPRYSNERGHGNIKTIFCEPGTNGTMRQLKTQFVGHTRPVHALALIPGRALISADYCLHIHYIIVWDVARNESIDGSQTSMWKNQKIAAGGGQILKRLRINNINFLNSVRRKADIYDGKTQRYVLKQYHKIRSIEGISTVRVPFRQSGCWSSRGQKESTDVLVLFCNTGRLLCYITLNLGSTSPMRILGYRKLPLNSGCWDEMNPSCFRMAAVSASRLLPSSQYANYAVAVDVLSTAKALLHNQSCHASLLRKLNAGLSCKTLPSDEETDMSYDTPEILSCGEDSDGFNSHDDVASFKFKREQRGNSDDDDADEDGLHRIEQHRSFQMFFPDFDDANPRPNEKTEGFGRASEGDNGCFFDDEAKATAPRVFAFNEHVCVAAYGDGSLRLQTMLPNFTDKSSLLAARCSSTVIPHPPPPQLHS